MESENQSASNNNGASEANTIPAYSFQEGSSVPVFSPTMAQFSNFSAFVKSIEHLGKAAGIIKVIPPAEWTTALVPVHAKLPGVSISHPIEQTFMGGGLPSGAYRQMNLEVRRAFSVQEWYDLCESPKYRTPIFDSTTGKVFKETIVSLPRKRKKLQTACPDTSTVIVDDKSTEPLDNISHEHLESVSVQAEPMLDSSFENSIVTQDSFQDHLSYFSNPETLRNSPTSDSKIQSARESSESYSDNESLHQIQSLARSNEFHEINNEIIGMIVEKTNTDSHFINNQTKRRKPAKERKREIEFDFDKIGKGFTPEYLKDLEKFYWKNITYGSPYYGADMLGSLFDPVCENSWNLSTFDNLLNNLNIKLPGVNKPYLYFGMWKATFSWHLEDMDLYSINYIHFGAPKQWYVIPPPQRQKFERYAQGLFFDESKSCPEFLRHKTCLISPNALQAQGIKVDRLVQYEGEFVITFPFGYHAGYNLGFNCAESVNFAIDSWIQIGKAASFCKCIGDSVKLDVEHLFEGKPPRYLEPVHVSTGSKKTVSQRQPKVFVDNRQCCLCPSTNQEGLLETDVPEKFAHKRCGEFIPETHIVDLNVENGPSREAISGLLNIPKDRWSLKCQYCKGDKKKPYKTQGACIQCYKVGGKCVRTYHVSCADANGVFMTDDFTCYCPQHAKPFFDLAIQMEETGETA
ncbi:Lysine-specific demethylase 4B [Physocladia obscura]|uniref:[histone H3]-trimethyl-L-lysine(9) demethylase n=1 Tax=Physocladia obscura TaxID=109957 RepID=A0AAD5T409_9FUNG|nr:Lysine-specific demethylase 4B [Physocladia obscura]